jgi:poly-gamma-glutamate capsule biosynthesis protein CapA/YwtB (metallophosphatase superfamily)
MKISIGNIIVFIIIVIIAGFLLSLFLGFYQPSSEKSRDTNITPLRLVFVGDIMLSRTVGDVITQKGPDFPFEHVHDILKEGDITMGNLESPISNLNTTICNKQIKIYCFKSSPESTNGLVYAGFDIVTLANNHALDYGPAVLNDTLLHLSDRGIQFTGVQQSDGEDVQNAVILHDPRMNVAYLGFNDIWLVNNVSSYSDSIYPRPWNASEEMVIQSVKRAQSQADIVVVNFHFGKEFNFTHEKRQEELAHAAADAGADIIIGHHPHVIQDVEIYHGSIIAYSLGNFIFDIKGNGAREGAILRVEIDPNSKEITGYSFDKVYANPGFQPRPGTTGMIISYYERLQSWSVSKLYSITG